MKKFFLFLLLVAPLAAWSQTDDLYFVPKKQKAQLVVKGAEEVYFVGDNDYVGDSAVDVVGNGYYTNDIYDLTDEYRYSTRIVRFQSPRRLYGSSLYGGLYYDCGFNDWYVYDDGYTINIVPTFNNPLAYCHSSHWYGYGYNWWNWWNWGGHNHYWGCNDYPNFYAPVYNSTSWRPAYRSNVPTNSSVTNGFRRENEGVKYPITNVSTPRRQQPTRTAVNGNGEQRRQQPTRTAVNGNGEQRRQQPTRTAVNGNTEQRRQQPTRTAVNGNNEQRRQQPARTAVNGNNEQRRQQPTRTAVNGNSGVRNQDNSASTIRRQQQRRENITSNSSAASGRRGAGTVVSGATHNNSSAGYNRPSSTSVSRSRGGSSSGAVRSSAAGSSRGYSGGSSSSGGGSGSSGSSSSSSGSSSRSGGSRR